LEGKLTNKRKLKKNIQKKVLNVNLKGNWNQDGNNRLGKMLHRGKEEHGRKLRKSYGKTEQAEAAWLSDDVM
jgi:hypothetical protein